MAGLNALFDPPFARVPVPVGSFTEFDGVNTNYRLEVYSIDDSPSGTRSVYVFAAATGSGFRPLYIGKAPDYETQRCAIRRAIDASQARPSERN